MDQAPKHYASSRGGSTALELFTLPPTDTSVLSAKWITYYPTSRIQRGSPIEFDIDSTADYIDLSKCYMKFRIKVTKDTGADIDNGKVIPVNNMLHTMVKQMSIKFNNTLVTKQNDTYPYQAYLQYLMSYPTDSAKSYLTTSLWYRDEPGKLIATDVDGGGDGNDVEPLETRHEFIAGSKVCELVGTPAHALFHSDRYLLGEVKMNIRIDLTSEAFNLMSTAGTEKLEVLDAEFMVRYVKIADSVRARHNAILTRTPAIYPLERGEVQAFNIGTGQSSFQKNNIFLDRVPRKVVVGLVTNAAYVGVRNQSPFNFQLHNLNNIKLLVNGEEYPTPAIQLPDDDAVDGYNSLFLGSGSMHRGQGLQLERGEWRDGFALFMWDLTPDGSGSPPHLHPEYRGQITVKGVFSAPTGVVLTLIVYGEFVDIMEVDGNKNVTYDLA